MKRIVVSLLLFCALGLVATVSPLLASDSQTPAVAKEQLVDLNTATEKQLSTLPGVGKVTAQRIVVYRSEQGKFTAVEELTKVKGVGKKTLEKIRPLVTVGS